MTHQLRDGEGIKSRLTKPRSKSPQQTGRDGSVNQKQRPKGRPRGSVPSLRVKPLQTRESGYSTNQTSPLTTHDGSTLNVTILDFRDRPFR
jgi:hypothetical protein